MKPLAPSALLLACTSLASCVVVLSGHTPHVRGSGLRASETRDVPAFTAVQLLAPGDAVVLVGTETSLEVSGDDNLLPLLETAVSDGLLTIRFDRDRVRQRAKLEVRIGTPALERFEVHGAGDVEIQGARGEELELTIQGSGNVRADGEVGHLRASISGSGEIALLELEAREADVSISGSGDIAVRASEALRYTISGSGDVLFAGDPKLSGTISGSGSIRRE